MHRMLAIAFMTITGFTGWSTSAPAAEFAFIAVPGHNIFPMTGQYAPRSLVVPDPQPDPYALLAIDNPWLDMKFHSNNHEKVARPAVATTLQLFNSRPMIHSILTSPQPGPTRVSLSAAILFNYEMGRFSFTVTEILEGKLDHSIKLKGPVIDAVGILPFTDRFTVYGKAGLNYAEAKDSFIDTGLIKALNSNPSKRKTNYKFGLGLGYDFTEYFSMRAEVEHYLIDDSIGGKNNIDLLSVSLVYRFSAGLH